jgi:hypothetical protein
MKKGGGEKRKKTKVGRNRIRTRISEKSNGWGTTSGEGSNMEGIRFDLIPGLCLMGKRDISF